jgi:hypothetical protein
MDDTVFICGGDDERDEGSSCKFHASGWGLCTDEQGDEHKLPQPWNAKTAVMRRPRVLVAANSDEMTALRG